MTKSEAIAGHRAMWNLIAKMIADGKHYKDAYTYKCEALKILGIKENLYALCFCCEYDSQKDSYSCNENCIIKWSNTNCDDSEYHRFGCYLLGENWKLAAKLAQIIANLPEREGVE